ncbi:MAG: WD40/YVTN/BNR-like repeat-containing protein, partial [Maricaulaceae bacterium]
EGDGEGGGLYRSEDYGESWTKVNGSREIQARSWYYMHIHADPKDADTVYIQNAPMKRSIDGGKSFTTIRGPHGDHHDLWINPLNPANMIDANDGGATVTFDGGQSWSTLHNQPTAQFYRVITDNTFPDYRLYAGQQDNSTVAIRSQAPDGRIGRDDYHSIGGGESAHVGFDPDNPRYVYAGSYLGTITEWDRDTNTTRDIRAYPELKFGVPAEERKHRWNWNAPIVVSHHDARVIYHAGERVFRSDDRGASWTAVSPDLTRAAPETLGKGGRPITNEVSENYATILYLAESPHDADVLWAGSDDGKLSVTQDGGENWTEITPPGIDDGMFNAIEPSPHNPGEAYVAFTRYKYSDRKPYVFKTSDFGRNWTALNTGLPKEAFVRVVREDPEHEGLLFAGTELGVYVSFDTGETWEAFKRNMPVVPVTDLRIQFDDLIVATQGRAFWILDDIGPLRQHHNDYADAEAALFKPSPSYILTSGGGGNGGQAPNPPSGAVMDYVVSEALNAALFPEPEAPTEDAANEETEEDADAGKPKTLTLEILNAEGEVLRTLKTDPKKGEEGGGSGSSFSLPAEVGINRIAWDRATDPLPKIEGLFAFPGGDDNMVDGYAVGPGTYTARLSVGEAVMGEETFEIRPDPRLEHDADAIAEQQRLVASAYAMVDELHTSVNSLRTANAQAQARVAAMTDAEDDDPVKAAAKALDQAIEDWEATVIAPEREFFQDVLNWGDKLASDLHVIYGTLDGARYGVTQGMRDRLKDVKAAFKSAMEARDSILDGPLADYSAAISDQPAVIVPAFVSD